MASPTVEHPMPGQYELSHLRSLEAEAIHIIREVAAEFEKPVLLFSGGKDSIVMLHMAITASATIAKVSQDDAVTTTTKSNMSFRPVVTPTTAPLRTG